MASHIMVGWREWVRLPQLRIPAIKAKVDTGARSSSVHAFDLVTERRDGADWVRFRVAPLREHSHFFLDCEAPVHDERLVRSSNGASELRIFIVTEIVLSDFGWPAEISLSNRELMQYPMLLGRQAMDGRVLVDPEKSYLTGRTRPHTYRDHGLARPPRTPR